MSKKTIIKKTIKSYMSVIACIAFLLLNENSFANQNYYKKHQSELSVIEDYLNNIENLSAVFSQESSSGSLEGKFFLSRNKKNSGKMRVEYLTQPKVLIVVNGSVLSYYDVELDEISRLSTNTTPASLLTRPNISFSAKDVEITDVKKSGDEIKVSLVKKNRKEAGEFSLIFKMHPLEFMRMEVKNDLDQIISVRLKNIDLESKIADKMFVIKTQEE